MEETEELEYLKILKGLTELPFKVGKNLLCDFVVGDYKNKSIVTNKLDELHYFGSIKWDKGRVIKEIDYLISKGMVELTVSDYNRFVKVLRLTIRGQNEIVLPTLNRKMEKKNYKKPEISEADLKKFEDYKEFLGNFNEEQKKAVISGNKRILCIAGAGSGKTTVLTKRIEHLINHKNIPPQKILAITFTRKAKEEMERRLKNVGIHANVHTFNSFCESILKKFEQEIYGRSIKVQSYGDKILAMNMALAGIGLDMHGVIEEYYTESQRKNKNEAQLANSYMNDCFSVLDYFKVTGQKEYDFSREVEPKNRQNARRVYQIIKYLKEHMNLQGLRDFSDQIIDAVDFLKKNPDKIPQFEHILVDEYQDVNSMQVELLNLLNPANLFAVGDPRQAIFGWRGSDINFILNFEKGGDFETVYLTKNYRSTQKIVDFINNSIREMELPDLEPANNCENDKIKIIDFNSEEEERTFVIKTILESNIPRDEIFVLSRTNRQIMELSQTMKRAGIAHVVKTDEIRNFVDARAGEVTLATVHAIKGLEARKVFLIGANEQNFPCKASDHPAIEMVKTNDYNKEEEERRLFYVAISRAKERLYITYSGKKPTYFINEEMIKLAK